MAFRSTSLQLYTLRLPPFLKNISLTSHLEISHLTLTLSFALILDMPDVFDIIGTSAGYFGHYLALFRASLNIDSCDNHFQA